VTDEEEVEVKVEAKEQGGRVQRVEPPWRPTARQVIAVVILVVILVFALVNLERAKIDFVFGDVTLPVFFIIAFPALFGFVAGVIVQRRRDRPRRA
jgi:uncharacterized integral membrane protein